MCLIHHHEIAFKEIFLSMSSRVFPKRIGIWVSGLRKILLCLLCWRRFLTYCSWRNPSQKRHKKSKLISLWKFEISPSALWMSGLWVFQFSDAGMYIMTWLSSQFQVFIYNRSMIGFSSSLSSPWVWSCYTTSIPKSETQSLPWNIQDSRNAFYQSISQSDKLCVSGYTWIIHLAGLFSRANLW